MLPLTFSWLLEHFADASSLGGFAWFHCQGSTKHCSVSPQIHCSTASLGTQAFGKLSQRQAHLGDRHRAFWSRYLWIPQQGTIYDLAMHVGEVIAVRGHLSFGVPIPWHCAGMMSAPPGHPGSPGVCRSAACMAASRAPALGTRRNEMSVQPVHRATTAVWKNKRGVLSQPQELKPAPGPMKAVWAGSRKLNSEATCLFWSQGFPGSWFGGREPEHVCCHLCPPAVFHFCPAVAGCSPWPVGNIQPGLCGCTATALAGP